MGCLIGGNYLMRRHDSNRAPQRSLSKLEKFDANSVLRRFSLWARVCTRTVPHEPQNFFVVRDEGDEIADMARDFFIDHEFVKRFVLAAHSPGGEVFASAPCPQDERSANRVGIKHLAPLSWLPDR